MDNLYHADYQYFVPNRTSPFRGEILVVQKQPLHLQSPVGTKYIKHYTIVYVILPDSSVSETKISGY